MFKPGQSGNPAGKKKGTLNDQGVMAIKKLLEDAFLRNRTAAIQKIDNMFQGPDNEDFKFLMKLKAEFEPKPRIRIEENITFSLEKMLDDARRRTSGYLAEQPSN